MATESYRLTAFQAIEAIKNDTLTVESYASSLLDCIQQRDSVVKAWAHLDREQVLAQARTLDKVPKAERGPLHGVAVGVKDVIYTKGKAGSARDAAALTENRHADTAQLAHLLRRPA